MKNSILAIFLLPMAALLLAGCNPKYNWREVRGKDAAFTALMPDKPVSVTRPVALGAQTVNMTMTAAEVDGVSFAVGTAQLAEARLAAPALQAMEEAMVHNIDGAIKADQPVGEQGRDIEAAGKHGDRQILLLAHFEIRDKRVYQVVVLGPAETLPRDEAKTFLTSFKAQ